MNLDTWTSAKDIKLEIAELRSGDTTLKGITITVDEIIEPEKKKEQTPSILKKLPDDEIFDLSILDDKLVDIASKGLIGPTDFVTAIKDTKRMSSDKIYRSSIGLHLPTENLNGFWWDKTQSGEEFWKRINEAMIKSENKEEEINEKTDLSYLKEKIKNCEKITEEEKQRAISEIEKMEISKEYRESLGYLYSIRLEKVRL